jgi:hypothetical protein
MFVCKPSGRKGRLRDASALRDCRFDRSAGSSESLFRPRACGRGTFPPRRPRRLRSDPPSPGSRPRSALAAGASFLPQTSTAASRGARSVGRSTFGSGATFTGAKRDALETSDVQRLARISSSFSRRAHVPTADGRTRRCSSSITLARNEWRLASWSGRDTGWSASRRRSPTASSCARTVIGAGLLIACARGGSIPNGEPCRAPGPREPGISSSCSSTCGGRPVLTAARRIRWSLISTTSASNAGAWFS